MGIADPFAEAHAQRLELAGVEDAVQIGLRHCLQRFADIGLVRSFHAQRCPDLVGDDKKTVEELRRVRPAPDRQEVDALDEQAGLALAGVPDGLHQFLQPRNVAVVADTQQRAGRDIANSRCFDDQAAGLAAGELLVPVQHIVGDPAFLIGTPGHHRRHPGAAGQGQRANLDRAEPQGALGLFPRRPGARLRRVSNPFRRFPHRNATLAAIRLRSRPVPDGNVWQAVISLELNNLDINYSHFNPIQGGIGQTCACAKENLPTADGADLYCRCAESVGNAGAASAATPISPRTPTCKR